MTPTTIITHSKAVIWTSLAITAALTTCAAGAFLLRLTYEVLVP